ncbi:MAG: phenylalanine--tRNA ligase subunit beta [Gammaproteobacteria bacterium]|nr:phenylalanine--tRNA ligase subunit beta [Gammaproteobacteria bacterium]MDH5652399.1 phenylalanine--tRNA ligase subunit beta [Gammaproteobacteria bacterium]
MKFSEQWLREWVNPAITTQELAHQLTMAGLEVDVIEPVAAEFDLVVVGEVLSLEAHPDADKLRVCQVNVGESTPLTIVCGAANVRQGVKVPAALIGANLPGGLKIKKSKLRGVESHGMLCSAKELGMAEQAEGLLILPDDAPIGESVRDYLALDDVSIELGLTPNRGDCLSIAGIAREVGVINQRDVTTPTTKNITVALVDKFNVKVSAPRDCPAYVGRIIRGIDQSATTPIWMQERLRRCGVRSLGPVVDVTNYILLELGQPMHAFDLDKLSGSINVRHAKAGEKIKLLDEQLIELTEGTLVIADDKAPVALAGIMGGADSAVSDGTKDIFLESAFFAPLAIAGKARSYGLHTDSSHRFERGVSPDLQSRAMERATELLLSIVGGKAGPIVKQQSSDHLPVKLPLPLRAARIARVLGVKIPANDITAILKRLGMEIFVEGEDWKVTPPIFRFDIEQEVDLIEEIGRIFGYDNLPESRPVSPMVMQPNPEERLDLRRIRHLLTDLGYQEAITYSFVEPGMQSLFTPELEALPLANPISAEMAVMRTSLWPGLVQAMLYNLHRQQNRISLFECGLKFVRQDSELKQEMVLAGLRFGEVYPEQWGLKAGKGDFFDVKNDVEAICRIAGAFTEYQFEPAGHAALHPGQSVRLMRNGVEAGWLGVLHPSICRKLGLTQTVVLFELNLAVLQRGRVPVFEPLSKFPAIRRDLAFVINETITAQQVRDTILKTAPESLRSIELFDVYTGEGIDSGRKSLALGLTLQDLSRTLTDSEVDTVMAQIKGVLQSDLGATLRE